MSAMEELEHTTDPAHSDWSPVNARVVAVLSALRGYLTEHGTTNEQDDLLRSIGLHEDTVNEVQFTLPKMQGLLLMNLLDNPVLSKSLRHGFGIKTPIEALNHPDARLGGPVPARAHSMDDGTGELEEPACAECGCRH